METMTNDQLVELITVTKDTLRSSTIKAYQKVGLDASKYGNGMMLPSVSKKWTMEDNIKNVLSIFTNNYTDGVSFQAQSEANYIRNNKIEAFLESKGLIADFRKYMNEQEEGNRIFQSWNEKLLQ